jgi:hypothetical protein
MTTLHEVSSEIAGFTLEASFLEIGFLGLTSAFEMCCKSWWVLKLVYVFGAFSCNSVLTMFLVIGTKDYLSSRPQSLLKWCQE